MSTTVRLCEICQGDLKFQYSDAKNAYYKCPFCGATVTVPMEGDAEHEFELAKKEMIARLHMSFVDWQATDWDQLYRDLNEFMIRNEQLHNDIRFQMGLTACLTKGFNIIDAEKYNECKKIFKATEKIYKAQLKLLKMQVDSTVPESVSEYKEAREKYIKCRNDYLNTKAMWKILFFLLKKISFPI